MTSETDAMGLITRKYPENMPAEIKTRLFDDLDDDEMLEAWEKAVESFDPESAGRLPLRLKLYELLVEKTGSAGYPVIAAPSATFAQVVQALGYERTIRTISKKPEIFHKARAVLSYPKTFQWARPARM